MKNVKKNWNELLKPGIDSAPEVKALLKEVIEESFELVKAEREAYPYNLDEALDELEYHSRDGFSANSFNKGGYKFDVFETVPQIVGSGNYPASKLARKAIDTDNEQNRQYALEELGLKDKAELTDDESERVYNRMEEYGSDDTIMFTVCIMFHGTEAGIHSATVQVAVNWESPYHRSGISWMSGFKCEDYLETEVTWRSAKAGKAKMLKAVKQGIAKLF